jgi:hypothetical protein
MTWKKLLAGGASAALLVGWAMSLSDCTVCNGPQCFDNDGGTGTDTGTGNETSTTDSGNNNDSGVTCPSIKPTGKLYWDNAQGTGSCDKCMYNNCCAAATTCLNDKGAGDGSMDTCSDYVTCVDVTMDEPTCAQTDPMGKAFYQTNVLLGCMYTKCGVSCMVSDAGM